MIIIQIGRSLSLFALSCRHFGSGSRNCIVLVFLLSAQKDILEGWSSYTMYARVSLSLSVCVVFHCCYLLLPLPIISTFLFKINIVIQIYALFSTDFCNNLKNGD